MYTECYNNWCNTTLHRLGKKGPWNQVSREQAAYTDACTQDVEQQGRFIGAIGGTNTVVKRLRKKLNSTVSNLGSCLAQNGGRKSQPKK